MSRIGKTPIVIPVGVTVEVSASNVVTVKGPKGELKRTVDPSISVKNEGGNVVLSRPTDHKRHRSLHGLYRALIQNMVIGVSKGFTSEQELVGVGFKAEVKGQQLDLSLGFSHNLIFELPKEIKAETITEKGKAPRVILHCIDNQLLGQVAAKLRSLRKPEPYKGKGIKFANEVIRRKAGKSASKGK